MNSLQKGHWYIVELTHRTGVENIDEYGELYFKQIGMVYVEYFADSGEKQMVLIDDVENVAYFLDKEYDLQYFNGKDPLQFAVHDIRVSRNTQLESEIAAEYDLKRLEPLQGLSDLNGDLDKLNQETVQAFLSTYRRHVDEFVERSMPSSEQNKDIDQLKVFFNNLHRNFYYSRYL